MNNRPIKFIIDSGSPVTLIPKSQFNGITPLRPIGTEYRDVNDNRIKFEGKSVEINGKRNELELLMTTKKTNPLLGLDWMEKLGITLDTGETGPQINQITEYPDITTLKRKFRKLFNENHTVNGIIEVKIQLKEDAKLIQQKGRPIPIHLQQSVGKEINKLIKQGHIEKANNMDENFFVSPAVITVEKDKSVKIALDSRKLNEITIKRKSQMPNMEELISRISRKIADGPADEIWASKLNLDYAYGQLILSREARNLCIFAVTGGNFTGYYRFLKGFYGLADIPTIFQEKIDQTLENKHPAWLDDIIIVTKGPKEQHKKELTEVLTRLENAGYRLSENKSEFFKSEVEWIGHKIDQNGIRPLQDKLMAIKNLKQPNNEKELKSFLGAIQYLSKYIDNLSAQTDSLRQLLKKDQDWLWTEEHTQAFENLKQKITEIPCLAHYNSDYPNIITTDASTKGLGATLWQEQPDGKLKPIGIASRFLSDTEKKYAINELELLAVVWGLEHFRLYIYGKPIKLLTDHQALEPFIKRDRSNKTYSARLTRWLDRLAHFTINVNHIAGKHLALTDYLSRNPSMPPQTDEAYDQEYVINSIMPHYKFISKQGCLSNHANQSERETVQSEHKANNKPRPQDTHKQTAIDCLNNSALTRLILIDNISNFKMDVKTLDNLAAVDFSAETNQLIQRWKEIVKPGIYRMTGGKWKKYHEPKFLRNERKAIEERLQQIINAREQGDLRQRIGPQYSGGYQPNSGRSEQWTVDPFWEMDRPTPANHANQPGPSSQQELFAPVPMEEGGIESETDQDPSVLEVPAINWARYVGVKSVQYVKMGHAPKIAAMEENN